MREASGLLSSRIRVRSAIGLESIEQARQQDCAGAVDAIEARQINVDGSTPIQSRADALDRLDDGHRVRQIEWTSWRHAPSLPIPIGADRNVHPRIFRELRGRGQVAQRMSLVRPCYSSLTDGLENAKK